MSCTSLKPGTTTACEIPDEKHIADHMGRDQHGEVESWENETSTLAEIAELHDLASRVDEIQHHLEHRYHDSLVQQSPAIAVEIAEYLVALDHELLASVAFSLIGDLLITKLEAQQ